MKVNASGYGEAGASFTRRALKGFFPASYSPIDDIDLNNKTLRQRSRMLCMGAPIALAAVNTVRTKAIGTGLTCRSMIDRDVISISREEAKTWQKKTEAEFALWAKNRRACDALGMHDFYELQQIAMKSALMSGDVFALFQREKATALLPYTLRIHLIEADRVRTPPDARESFYGDTEGKTAPNGNRIHDGVEVDARGKAIAYHISNKYPDSNAFSAERFERIEATGKKTGLPLILHVMEAERPDQYRGVPFLAPVIETVLQTRRFTESEIMAAIVQTLFTAFITTDANPAEIPMNEVLETGEPDLRDNPDEYEMGPGSVLHLKAGEKVQFGNPNVPSANFDKFMETVSTQIGAALEIPADVLMKSFNTSYSASRGALLEMWDMIKMRRAWFVGDFCQPIYEAFLSEAVATGRVSAPGFFNDPVIRAAWCGTRWIGPVQGQIDPRKEAEAQLLLINEGIKTREQVTREMGSGDFYENMEQLARENEQMKNVFPTREVTTDEDGEADE